MPTVVPTDSRSLSCPPIGALPRNRLASSATGSALPISPTARTGLIPQSLQCVIARALCARGNPYPRPPRPIPADTWVSYTEDNGWLRRLHELPWHDSSSKLLSSHFCSPNHSTAIQWNQQSRCTFCKTARRKINRTNRQFSGTVLSCPDHLTAKCPRDRFIPESRGHFAVNREGQPVSVPLCSR